MKNLAKRAIAKTENDYKENVYNWLLARMKDLRKDSYILLSGQKYAHRTDRIQIGD